ncbi:MAG: hypothetical protein EBR82_04245 [Caulobacteraceae bacterium]|nr:hypothetical protein [Caulobacteraceae bacterium]
MPLENPSRAKTSYRHVKPRPMVQCKTNPATDEKNEGMLQLEHSSPTAKPLKKHVFSALLSHFWNSPPNRSGAPKRLMREAPALNHALYEYLNLVTPG